MLTWSWLKQNALGMVRALVTPVVETIQVKFRKSGECKHRRSECHTHAYTCGCCRACACHLAQRFPGATWGDKEGDSFDQWARHGVVSIGNSEDL